MLESNRFKYPDDLCYHFSHKQELFVVEAALYTIRDIARLANVSTATVSAVINNKDTVSQKLKSRVVQAMEALDYHPDQIARSLKVRRTYTIGMVIADVANPFFVKVLQGVEDEARKNRYSVIFCNSNEDSEVESLHLDTLFARRVDGVLLSPTGALAAEERLMKRRFPLVFFDRIPAGFSGPAVLSDGFGASREAAAHLIGLGHERLGIITGRLDQPTGKERLEGFQLGLKEAGLILSEDYIQHGNFKMESGYTCGRELLELSNPPTAIFVCNNQMTIGLLQAMAELHIPCPEQVSVLGFDDFEWSTGFTPRMTMIAQPAAEIGRKATEILIRTIQGDPASGEGNQIILPNHLIIRDSTSAPAL